MKKLTAIIVDDEVKCRNSLKALLELAVPEVDVIGMASSIREALQLVETKQPELVFLDVQLGEENGFDLLEQSKNTDFKVIFTTAHEDYAIAAIRASAADYLLKPINSKELKAAVERANNNVSEQRVQVFESEARIAISSSNRVKFIPVKDIVFCMADGSYTHVHTISGDRITASRNLHYFEDNLWKHLFLRVHRSYLVNLRHIQELIKSSGSILMSDGTAVKVALKYRDTLLERIGALT